jgi:hypothetical protein
MEPDDHLVMLAWQHSRKTGGRTASPSPTTSTAILDLKQLIDCWYKTRHTHVDGKGKTTVAAGVLKELVEKKILVANGEDDSYLLERSAIATAMKSAGVAPPPISHAWYERERSSNSATLIAAWWIKRADFRGTSLRAFPAVFKLGSAVEDGKL